MPVFSFSIVHGSAQAEQVELTLSDIGTAWGQAVIACGEALKDVDGRFGLSDELAITVSEAGRPLFEIRCASRRLSDQ